MTHALRALVAAIAFAGGGSLAAPPSNTDLETVCAEAEDPPHCARLVETMQLKRLPNLARRDGAVLSVALYPTGTATFTDSDDAGGRSYSLWDYLDGLNAVLVYTTTGKGTTFTLLQRTTNRRVELPTEPELAPDRKRLVTADVCELHCSNEVAVWQIAGDGIHKELTWSPAAGWIDAGAKWKDSETLVIEYTTSSGSGKTELPLGDPSWKRIR